MSKIFETEMRIRLLSARNRNSKDSVGCPGCGSFDVRYSYTRNVWDKILDLLFSMDAFRCRSCRRRFHKFHAVDDADEPTVKPGVNPAPHPAPDTE